MPKIVAKKIATPGSKPQQEEKKKKKRKEKKDRVGRPKKKRLGRGTPRKGNYRTKYTQEDFEKALEDVKAKRMSIRQCCHTYKDSFKFWHKIKM